MNDWDRRILIDNTGSILGTSLLTKRTRIVNGKFVIYTIYGEIEVETMSPTEVRDGFVTLINSKGVKSNEILS